LHTLPNSLAIHHAFVRDSVRRYERAVIGKDYANNQRYSQVCEPPRHSASDVKDEKKDRRTSERKT